MSKYNLTPRGPVRGIGDTIITEKTEVELNDFEALKILLQGHTLTTGKAPSEKAVLISDFVEGVDPQVINESVNLVPDFTAGDKTVNASYCKVPGYPRDYKPGNIEIDTNAEPEEPADQPQTPSQAPTKPEGTVETPPSSEQASEKK